LKKSLRAIERAFADIAELADALSDGVRDAERGAGREEASPPAHHRQAPRPAQRSTAPRSATATCDWVIKRFRRKD